MTEQKVLVVSGDYSELDAYLKECQTKKILLVCGGSFSSLDISRYFDTLENRMGIKVARFNDFKSNPSYESVLSGVNVFQEEKCDLIIAVGGGSAIDVAKCIKLYSNMDNSLNYLKQTIVPNSTKLVVVPTTAGTGSEATRYAVIYFEGEKQSVSDYSCIPSAVIFDSSVLRTLPDYHKKATMMDALCHAIESYWSINSTEESQGYSREAIKLILANKDAYLVNDEEGNVNMLKAANLAGKAINITQTTAGHAMCYKLTSLYGIAHGHAAALCVSKLFPFMVAHADRCIDPRGEVFFQRVLGKIADAMSCDDVDGAVNKYDEILKSLSFEVPEPREGDYDVLKTSVNLERLKNNPIELDEESIDDLYHQIMLK